MYSTKFIYFSKGYIQHTVVNRLITIVPTGDYPNVMSSKMVKYIVVSTDYNPATRMKTYNYLQSYRCED